jgi:hypothetical protein
MGLLRLGAEFLGRYIVNIYFVAESHGLLTSLQSIDRLRISQRCHTSACVHVQCCSITSLQATLTLLRSTVHHRRHLVYMYISSSKDPSHLTRQNKISRAAQGAADLEAKIASSPIWLRSLSQRSSQDRKRAFKRTKIPLFATAHMATPTGTKNLPSHSINL